MLRLHISESKQYGLDLSSLEASDGVPCWTVVQTVNVKTIKPTPKDFTDPVKTFYNQAEAETWVASVQKAYEEGDLRMLRKLLDKKTRRQL